MTKSVIRLPDCIFESSATLVELCSNSQTRFFRSLSRLEFGTQICQNQLAFALNPPSICMQTTSFACEPTHISGSSFDFAHYPNWLGQYGCKGTVLHAQRPSKRRRP